ncbi:hypothetical protein IU440_26995 [Nocardia cyriacigeorgica]|uniref:hypothetical protein n=1 Tax=Nocardia cyriacigeorgica TaxID=135487 RepID=UPI001895AABB|nr:hypothetical protein [Nocardia cyriacigeorgica]MBF6428328.1 hypothetical protein [Nocardia cyriacigeorgica]
MDYYRELMTDDPIRRSQAARNSDQGEGYLFGPGPRYRRLRALMDLGTIASTDHAAAAPALNQLERLVGFGLIDCWRMSLPSDRPGPQRLPLLQPGVVYLDGLPEAESWSALVGGQFYWTLHDDGGTERGGCVRLTHRMPLAGQGQEGEDIARSTVISGIARAVGADIVVSCAPTVGRADLEVNYESNFFTPEQAVVLMSHYLRTQHVYPIPCGTARTSRHNFYESAVWAIAPGVFDWRAKCSRNAPQSEHLAACSEMINRLMRALRAYDDLLMHLGQASSSESSEDAAEALDLMLLMLCGAIDVLARSLHAALGLPKAPKNAKMHLNEQYYTPHIRPLFADHPDIERLDALQTGIRVVFDLRNTVHNHSLKAMGGGLTPALGAPVAKGRRTLMIPPDSGETLFGLDEKFRRQWGIGTAAGFHEVPVLSDVVTALTSRSADMADFAAMALSSTLAFADQLCGLFASTDIPDKDPVLTGTATASHQHFTRGCCTLR